MYESHNGFWGMFFMRTQNLSILTPVQLLYFKIIILYLDIQFEIWSHILKANKEETNNMG